MKQPRHSHMNRRIFPTFALLLSWLALTSGCHKQESSLEDTRTEGTDSVIAMQPVDQELGMFDLGEDDPDADGISEAPVGGVAIEQTLPTNFRPNEVLRQLIRLTQSGVEDSVLLAFVANSSSRFNLGPEEIIYLNDIGVPSDVIVAIIEHDRMETAAETTPPPQLTPAPGSLVPAEIELASDAPDEMPADDSGAAAIAAEPEPAAVNYSTFYDALQPYGNWVNVEGYGRCWQPAVVVANRNWRPYCDRGRWVYTESGWYWLSGYSWGWAPFHYGRWFPHERLGWCWTPDVVWGPSWVTWRYTDDYCGWAPLPPRTRFRAGQGLVALGRPVPGDSDCGVKPGCYTFVPFNKFRDHRLVASVLPRQEVARIYGRTVVATRFSGNRHTIVNNGLPVERVAAATHSEVHRVAVQALVRQPQPHIQDPQGTLAIHRSPERTRVPAGIRQPNSITPSLPTTANSPARHEVAVPPRTVAANSADPTPSPVHPPERAVLDPVAHVPTPATRPAQAVVRIPNRREIQSPNAEVYPPGSLVVRGRKDPEASSPAPRQPAWVQTEPEQPDPRPGRTQRLPQRAVLPRTEVPQEEPAAPQPPPVTRRNDRAVAQHQPRDPGPPNDASPVYNPPPVRPPAQMPPPPQMPPVQIPAQPPPSRSGPFGGHSSPSVADQPRPAQPETRTSNPRPADPPRSESRSESQGRPVSSGRGPR
jgi:hypothetical protein